MVQAWRAFADLLPVLVLALIVAVPVGVWCARRRVLRDGESWREALLVVGVRMSAVAALLDASLAARDPCEPFGALITSVG